MKKILDVLAWLVLAAVVVGLVVFAWTKARHAACVFAVSFAIWMAISWAIIRLRGRFADALRQLGKGVGG